MSGHRYVGPIEPFDPDLFAKLGWTTDDGIEYGTVDEVHVMTFGSADPVRTIRRGDPTVDGEVLDVAVHDEPPTGPKGITA